MSLTYLRATRPNGNVHASLCAVGLGYAPEFRRVMERQGLTVTAYSKAEYRALCGQEAVASEMRVLPLPPQDAPELAPAEQAPPGLPAAGQEITTELLGRCTVAYTLRYPGGEEVPVAIGPKGASMIRAGA